MRSVIQKKCYGSVKVFWLDKELLFQQLRASAQRAAGKDKRVERIILFGSLAKGKAGAFSDADILIIVKESNKRFIDRPADFRDYFSGMGIATDLFVYTKKEIEEGNGLIKTALSYGKILYS